MPGAPKASGHATGGLCSGRDEHHERGDERGDEERHAEERKERRVRREQVPSRAHERREPPGAPRQASPRRPLALLRVASDRAELRGVLARRSRVAAQLVGQLDHLPEHKREREQDGRRDCKQDAEDGEAGPVLPVTRGPADEHDERDRDRRPQPDDAERAHPAADRSRERKDPPEDADRVPPHRPRLPPRQALAIASQSRRSTSSSASTGATTSSLPTSSTLPRSERAAARARRRAPPPFTSRARKARAIPASAPPASSQVGIGMPYASGSGTTSSTRR